MTNQLRCIVQVIFVSLFFCNAYSGNSDTEGSSPLEDDPDFPDMGPWIPSLYFEEMRADKVMKGPSSTIYASTKYVVNKPSQEGTHNKEVTETDMYLLNAIEKLAYKFDALEKRVRRTEELIFHVMEGSNIKRQDACPANFTRVARNCYHFSDREYNWKSAASMCKSLGSNLLEIESRDEFMEVVTFIQATNHLRGYEFWTGGLNPGLLWIWANSARPVLPKKPSNRPEETVVGTGRCLSLALNKAKLYQYQGVDCGHRTRYICEHEENATIRALKRIQKSLHVKEGDTS